MAFRFIFFGDNSQNENIADLYASQTEANFRLNYQETFTSFQQNQQINSVKNEEIPASTTPKTLNTDNKSLNEIVTGVVQIIANNPDTESNSLIAAANTSEPVSKLSKEDVVVAETANNKQDVNNISIETLAEDSTFSKQPVSDIPIEKSIDELAAIIPEVLPQTETNLPTTNLPASNPEWDQLLQKMQQAIDNARKSMLTTLDEFQKPQLQYYYGADETYKDIDKNQNIKVERDEQKLKFEREYKQKLFERELRNQEEQLQKQKENKKNLLIEEQSREKIIQNEKKTELEKILAKKLEEVRNKDLFEK